jgi:hypothetical protein
LPPGRRRLPGGTTRSKQKRWRICKKKYIYAYRGNGKKTIFLHNCGEKRKVFEAKIKYDAVPIRVSNQVS